MAMTENIILKKDPKIEFQLLDNGFHLLDSQTERNSGFYAYDDIQSIRLKNSWFPRLAKWMRVITGLMNGAPYFPDADSYKKASLTFQFEKTKLGIWLTDIYMADTAKRLEKALSEKRSIVKI